MTRIKVPCLGCYERNENCHTICPRYIEYKKLLTEQNEQIRKVKAGDREQDQITRSRIARVAGGKKRRWKKRNE